MQPSIQQTYRSMQRAIQQRYDLHALPEVENFVSHDNVLVEKITGQKNDAPEVLLVHENKGDLEVTLFFEKSLIDSFQSRASIETWASGFNEYCTILEGISHFVYLVWNAQYGRQIKPVEMELQAEVDKFVFAALDDGENALPRNPRRIHDKLFKNVSFAHAPGTRLFQRYQVANRYAHRYCGWLSTEYQLTRCNGSLYAELARFYRMGAADKFNHIRIATL